MMDNPTVEHLLNLEKPLDTLDTCRDGLSELILETLAITTLAMTPDSFSELTPGQQFCVLSLIERNMGRIQTEFDTLVSFMETVSASKPRA